MRALIAIPVAALLILPLTAASTPRSQTSAYVAGAEQIGPTCLPGLPVTPGGACFAIRAGESSVVLDVHDAAGHPWIFYQVAPLTGANLAQGVVCDTSSPAHLDLPAGSIMLKVYVGETEGALFCPLGPTPGTTGTITATFS